MIPLVDADSLVWAASAVTREDPPEYCFQILKSQLTKMAEKFEVTELEIWLSGNLRWRDGEATIRKYKGNRKQPPPLHFEVAREYLIKHWAAGVYDDEADDAIAIRATHLQDEHSYLQDPVICAIDKDLDNVPGWHYNWKKDHLYEVSPEEALRNFYTQVLEGDGADNILGLPNCAPSTVAKYGLRKGLSGCGAKSAEKIINQTVGTPGVGTVSDLEETLYLTTFEAYLEYAKHKIWTVDKLKAVPFEAIVEGTHNTYKENATLLWLSTHDKARYEVPCNLIIDEAGVKIE
jgi:hypothetical protein|tara:strand:+ start:943 stop:1815 length:873 start_codon:yes stop_codon:yes gene_type:complete